MKLLLDMSTALKVIPRLCHTFKLTDVNFMPYSYAIAHDRVCSHLQTEIDYSTLKSEFKFIIGSEILNITMIFIYDTIVLYTLCYCIW